MSRKIGLFLVGYKGLFVLTTLLNELGNSRLGFVVVGRDSGVENDYYDELKRLCIDKKLPFLDQRDLIDKVLPEVGLKYAIGWRWLIPNDKQLVIFHDSLLPKYRGFAPLVNGLIAGEKELGVTALIASEKYDEGPIIAQTSTKISYPMTIKKAIEIITPIYAELAISVFRKFLGTGKLAGHEQNDRLATYSPWRDELDYSIPWDKSSDYIERFCDAVGFPYRGAFTYWGTRRIRVEKVKKIGDIIATDRSRHTGKVIFRNKLHPAVICGIGIIQVEKAFFDDSGKSILKDFPFRVRFTEFPIISEPQ